MSMFRQNCAYFNGLDQQNGRKVALANIPGSLTTDYILFSLEVPSATSADINYGLSKIVLATDGHVTPSTDELLCSIVRAGVTMGGCERVWLSIGCKGSSAFANIQTILSTGGTLQSTLLANFGAIAQAIKGIKGAESVGFDMDYEGTGDEPASRVANLTIALYNQFKCAVTFCPLRGWPETGITALQQIYSTLGRQPVVGYNLQTYVDGNESNPQWLTDYIASNWESTGTDGSFLVCPIVSCDPAAAPVSTPNHVVEKLRGWSARGASLWATASLSLSLPNTLVSYSSAIAAGIF